MKEFILALGILVLAFLVVGDGIRNQLAELAHPQRVKYAWCRDNYWRVFDEPSSDQWIPEQSAEQFMQQVIEIDRICIREALK